tara:strand:- start:116136 stop:117065 length:930 start_codon:yes stop_codon:yes gene_type:complete
MLTRSKVYRSVAITILFALFTNKSACQEYIDLVKISYSISPSNTFDASEEKTTINQFNGDVTLPIQVNDRVTFLTGSSYERVEGAFNVSERRSSVSSILFKLGTNLKMNSKWSGMFLFLPKLASDMKDISSQDFQIGGVGLLKYKKSRFLNYKFGLYSNRESFGTMLVPVAGLYYQDRTERLEINALLPVSANINYSLVDQFRIGLNFKGEVRSYDLADQLYTIKDRYITRSTNEVSVYGHYEFKNNVNVKLGLGYSVGRSFRMYDEKVKLGIPLTYIGDQRNQINSDLSDGWIIDFSLFYRFHFDSSK